MLCTAFIGGSAIVLQTAAPAIACGFSPSSKQPEATFRLNNGLQLGTNEADVIKTLGRPQTRQKEGVRCPSNRVNLNYEDATIVVLDTMNQRSTAFNHRRQVGQLTQPQLYRPARTQLVAQRVNGQDTLPVPNDAIARNGRIQKSDIKNESPAELIVVKFTTQSPKWTLSNGIRVGDHRRKVLNAYGKPQFQSTRKNQTILCYRQGNESLRIQLVDDRVNTLELGFD
ncbi:MAG: hypothetical protein HC805_02275 [Alkalinema sp. RL_2_19]|nr:hypothetical protein [Alkalinema sp. RL_2_19]